MAVNYSELLRAKIYFIDYGEKSIHRQPRLSENMYYITHAWYRDFREKLKRYRENNNTSGSSYPGDYHGLVWFRPNKKKGLDILSYVYHTKINTISMDEPETSTKKKKGRPKKNEIKSDTEEKLITVIAKEDVERTTRIIINFIEEECNDDIVVSVPIPDAKLIKESTGIDIVQELSEAGINVITRPQ